MAILNKFIIGVIFGIILVVLANPINGASTFRKRATDDDNNNNNNNDNNNNSSNSSNSNPVTQPPPMCVNNSPCGWAVYTPFTRNIDYFMKNNCECPDDTQCIRTDDDLSVSAFVYRCRNTMPSHDKSSS